MKVLEFNDVNVNVLKAVLSMRLLHGYAAVVTIVKVVVTVVVETSLYGFIRVNFIKLLFTQIS